MVRSGQYNNFHDRRDASFKQRLEAFYCELVLCLNSAAEHNIWKESASFYKYWWNKEIIIHLKKNSIDIHAECAINAWPHTGPICEEKWKAKFVYKTYLKQQHKNELSDVSNSLHKALMTKSPLNFGNCEITNLTKILKCSCYWRGKCTE